MSGFKDHFSTQSEAYARIRPDYPGALYDWLCRVCGRRRRAWDCATGNGQAAVRLARRFDEVIATDASAAQIAAARPHPGVRYRVATAEESGLDDASVDLVAVAQALHWFDHERFNAEVRRVTRPGGVVAAWTYQLERVSPDIDALIDRYFGDIVGPYWPVERRHVEAGYRDIPFPFGGLEPPSLELTRRWSLADQLAYFRTWSATERYRADRGEDPVARIAGALERAWGPGTRLVRWPLVVLAGRVV